MISHKLTKDQLDQLPAFLVVAVYTAQIRLFEKEQLRSSKVSEACANELM